MKFTPAVVKVVEDLGLTVNEVLKTKCILTEKGFLRLNPCSWAQHWIRNRGQIEITWHLVRYTWGGHCPKVWIGTYRRRYLDMYRYSTALGPVEDWPWKGELFHLRFDLTSNDIYLLLKAFIMKKGKGS